MTELKNILDSMSADIAAVKEWADELYHTNFNAYFQSVRSLYVRFQSNEKPVTDAELEEILTSVPLQLFTVSEALSQFKINKEIVNMKAKQLEAELVANSSASTKTDKKEEAATATLDYKLVQTVLSVVITRVENEISFSRELIMGAKKIWDSRRANSSIPTGMVIPEDEDPEALPGYDSVKQPKKRYIQ